ncbi:MAG: TetR/AcrR family transcriptional regulator [Candidatus Eisenbacteria bacterium]
MNPQTTTKKTKSRDPIRTRAAILLAARMVFEAHGLHGARTSDIAKKAKVPQGLLYHYFAGKEDLFRAALEDALEPYFQSTIELLENPNEAGLTLLERAIRMHFQFLREHPHVPRLMAWWHADQGWKHGSLLPADKSELCERPYVLGVQRIREGQEAGAVRAELDPLLVIDSFLTLSMNWHVNFGEHVAAAGLDPNDKAALEALHDRGLEHIVELVLRGVAADRSPNAKDASDAGPGPRDGNREGESR